MRKRLFFVLLTAFLLLFSACGNMSEYTYPDGEHEHLWGSTYTVTPATCSEHGVRLRYCKLCHEEFEQDYDDPDAHIFDDTVVAPTEREEGYTVRVCTLCGLVLPHENVVSARYALCETDETDHTLPTGATALLLSDTKTHAIARGTGGEQTVSATAYRRLALTLTIGELITAGELPAAAEHRLQLYVYDGDAASVLALCALMETDEGALLERVNARMETLGVQGATLTSLTASTDFGTAALAATARVFARVLDEPTAAAALAAAVPPVKAVPGFETVACMETDGLCLSAVRCGDAVAFLLIAGDASEETPAELYATLQG